MNHELIEIARAIEALKQECGMDPESPRAIQNSRYMTIANRVRALAATAPNAGAPLADGFVLVPKRMTRAMEQAIEEEGWQWADILAAAGVITEAEHEAIQAAPAQQAEAVVEPMDAAEWAELYRLREAVKGPDGYATWQDAATAERVRRVKAERDLAAAQQADLTPAQILHAAGKHDAADFLEAATLKAALATPPQATLPASEAEMRAILQELHHKFNTRVYGTGSYIKRDMRDRITAVLATRAQPQADAAEPVAKAVKATHWMDDRGLVVTDDWLQNDPHSTSDYRAAYNIPCIKKRGKVVPIAAQAPGARGEQA